MLLTRNRCKALCVWTLHSNMGHKSLRVRHVLFANFNYCLYRVSTVNPGNYCIVATRIVTAESQWVPLQSPFWTNFHEPRIGIQTSSRLRFNRGLSSNWVIAYLCVYIVGSQVSSVNYWPPKSLSDFAMLILTNRETSIFCLGMIASCLGAWRQMNQNPDNRPRHMGTAYASACNQRLHYGRHCRSLP